jgi:hypothetical protein
MIICDYLRLFTMIQVIQPEAIIMIQLEVAKKNQTIIRDYCIISQKTIISLIPLRLFHLLFSSFGIYYSDYCDYT